MGLIKLALVRFTTDKFKKIVRVSDINGFTPRNKNDFKNKDVYNVLWDVIPTDGGERCRETYPAHILCLGVCCFSLAEPVLGSTVRGLTFVGRTMCQRFGVCSETLETLKKNAQDAKIRNITELFNTQAEDPTITHEPDSQVQTESEVISKRKRKILVVDEAKKRMLMNLDRDTSQTKSAEDSSERTCTEDKETTQSGSSLPSSSLNAEGLKSTVFGESNRIDLEEFTSLSKTTSSKSSSFHFNSPAMDAFSLNVQENYSFDDPPLWQEAPLRDPQIDKTVSLSKCSGKSKLGFQYYSKDGGSAGKRRGDDQVESVSSREKQTTFTFGDKINLKSKSPKKGGHSDSRLSEFDIFAKDTGRNRSSDGMMQVKQKETPRSGESYSAGGSSHSSHKSKSSHHLRESECKSRNPTSGNTKGSRSSEGMVTDKQYFIKQKETSRNSGERHCDRSSSQSSDPQHSRRTDKILRNQSSGDKLLNQISNKSREKESARSYSDLSHHGRAHNSRVSGSIVNGNSCPQNPSPQKCTERSRDIKTHSGGRSSHSSAKSSLLKSHASIGSQSEAHAPANNSQDGDDNGFYVEKERAPSTDKTPHGSKQHSSSKRPHVNLNSNSHGGTGKKNKNKGYMELGHMIHGDLTGTAPLKKNGNGEVHIGNGVWISEDNWTQRYSILPKLTIVTRELMAEVWGPKKLSQRSLAGVACPTNKKRIVKAKATPAKINAVLACSVGRLLSKGVTDPEVIDQYIKSLRTTMRDKFNESDKTSKPKKPKKPATARMLFPDDSDDATPNSHRRGQVGVVTLPETPMPPHRHLRRSPRHRSRSPGRQDRGPRTPPGTPPGTQSRSPPRTPLSQERFTSPYTPSSLSTPRTPRTPREARTPQTPWTPSTPQNLSPSSTVGSFSVIHDD
ncbi:BEN domain-containing protein 5 [Frankliniella fusca]|uniref:BEN domain-containing protein 5 n=1 Tax=Frankliniella fusca TaxID=407009 RepID=A0AAE1IXK5_9NEOP|nr:BEN domain-containing protein 5 [Frankliniella fusca]